MSGDFWAHLAAYLFPGIICRGVPGAVYLTFDDGPDPDITPRLLELLAAEGCRATFFVTGGQAERHPGIVRAAAQAGHTIGSHGFRHRALTFTGRRRAREELARASRMIATAAGASPTLFRPPYGRMGPGMLHATRELGMTIVLWSLSPKDYRSASSTRIAEQVAGRAKPGDIVLLHDRGPFASTTLNATADIIRGLHDRGFSLEALKPPPEQDGRPDSSRPGTAL